MGLAGTVFNWVLFCLGQCVGYVPQYREIARLKDSSGFSPFVCLVLLLASLLRVIFWIGRRFEAMLLCQSLVMILCQLMLLELCVRMSTANKQRKPSANALPIASRQQGEVSLIADGVADGDAKPPLQGFVAAARHHLVDEFWQWRAFSSYVSFLAAFFCAVLLVTWAVGADWAWDVVGFLSLCTESALCWPQILRNRARRSTEGCSTTLVAVWCIGDLYKTTYFIKNGSPIQFLVCGIMQLTGDAVVVAQFVLYRKSPRAAAIAALKQGVEDDSPISDVTTSAFSPLSKRLLEDDSPSHSSDAHPPSATPTDAAGRWPTTPTSVKGAGETQSVV